MLIYIKEIDNYRSPKTTMHVGQMLVAEIVISVWDHLVWLTLEAHTDVASTACHSKAPVNSFHRNLASLIWALPYAILLHEFFEDFISPNFGLYARHSRVISLLSYRTGTLQLIQKVDKHTSHSMF
jgi:hypothetical protein